ncbi:MAG: J domain-containing protein [Dehalococcoidia bacterium]|nr:J domain-containing protein [Dehalococcoidia bacterium]
MADFEDYYEVLQVHPLAEPEVIQKAYTALANKYHPDKNPSAAAAAKMRKINSAYDVLKDPEKRRQYDDDWKSKNQAPRPPVNKPKPAVEPDSIQFSNVKPNVIQHASFIIRNAGGAYKKIWFSNPASWVKVTTYASLSESDELPLKVEIEAAGDERNRDYVEFIKVRLDDEETRLRVGLSTQTLPADRPQSAAKGKFASFISPLWFKLTLGIALAAIVVFAVIELAPSLTGNNQNSQGTPATPPSSSSQRAPGQEQRQVSREESSTTSATSGDTILTEIDLSSISNFTTRINGLPSGFQTFNGIPFYIAENQIFMTQYGSASLPDEGSISVSISNPLNVFILINTTDTYQQFLNKQAGKVTLVFDNNASQEIYLIVGQNIREYTTDSPTVQTVSEPSTLMAWQGGTNPAFLIDMLTIPVSTNNQSRTLKQIVITDVSDTMTDSSNPGLIIWALTVSHVAE